MAHLHPNDVRERDSEEYEVMATFESMYRGSCTLDNRHDVKRGTRVGKIRLISNPLLPVPGVACAQCVKMLPRARQ